MSIVLSAVVGIFMTALAAFKTSNDNFDRATIAQLVIQKVQNEIRYANTVTIDNSVPTTGKYIYSGGGIITDSVSNYYTPSDCTCSITFSEKSSDVIGVVVTINGYSVYSSVYLMNLASGKITDNTDSSKTDTALTYT